MSTQDKIQKVIDEEYGNLSVEERKELYKLYIDRNTTKDFKENLEKIIFYKRPPTPEEFLDPEQEWLPKNVIDSIFPEVKKELCEILAWDKNYNKVVEYGATRLGKSFMARLMIVYTIIFFHHLREPAMYYGLSPLTELCIYLISFKLEKTKQIYLNYIYKILRKSKRFKQVKIYTSVYSEQEKVGQDIIVWSKSAETGVITLASGLQIQLGNDDALSSIGADAIQAYLSEIGWFIEYAGATEDNIFRLYTDICDRIEATVGTSYLAFVYLDTSANNSESLIENHIINDLSTRENCHFKWQSRWEARPYKFPKWQATGKTFKVITGDGSTAAQIVDDEKQLEGVSPDLIIDVPIDSYQMFKDAPIKSIKDIAGRPTQSENKFITDGSYIDNIFDNETLVNVEGQILADAADKPDKQIWNQIYNKFFFKNAHGKYSIRRAPSEYRYWGLDYAFSAKGDVTGLCCLHKEWSRKKEEIVYVVDFAFVLTPGEKGISLDAPSSLITECAYDASLPTYAIYSDTKESATHKQALERAGFKFITQSVDKDIIPYQYFLTCMANGLIKAGKNIFLKNNLKGLVLTRKKDKNGDPKGKEKVDHLKGPTNNKYFGDWKKSTCGIFAKDCSDAVCQALYGASTHEYIPSTVYESENERFSADDKKTTELLENLINTKDFY